MDELTTTPQLPEPLKELPQVVPTAFTNSVNDITPDSILGLPEEPEVLELAKRRPVTLKTIREHRPHVLSLALNMLRENLGIRQTAKACNLDTRTVTAIREEYKDSLPDLRDQAATSCRSLATQTLERMQEKIDADAVPVNLLPIYTGILLEKAELLSGGATQRVEEVKPQDDYKDLKDILSQMNKAAKASKKSQKIKSPTINVTPTSQT